MPEIRHGATFDYNDENFRHGVEEHGLDYSILRDEYRDVHPEIADHLAGLAVTPVLDIGCGPTQLGRLLDERGVPWVGVDAAINRLKLGSGPRLLGDAVRLPFPDNTFGGVTALYMLYHFADPLVPIREAYRVLRPGGVFAACAPGRYDEPELAPFRENRPPDSFDSDNGVAMISSVFEDVEKDAYEMKVYRFPNRNAVWNYLVARMTPPEVADDIARKVDIPLWLTKRGGTIWGRKPR